MTYKSYQRGALLMAAVMLVVIIVAIVTAMSFLSVSNIGASSSHMSSAQAFFIARSGLKRATYQFKSGTACASLTNTNLAIGAGSFTTTGTAYPAAATTANLSAAISGTAINIPVTVTSGAFVNYAPHGRIRIENEEIDYAGTSNAAAVCGSAPCFTGATRGTNNTSAAAHASGVAILQENQCRIRSTGTVGSIKRIVESVELVPPARAYFLNGGSVQVSNAAGGNNIGSTGSIAGYNPQAGDNLVIVAVTLKNTNTRATPIQNIAAGTLQLRKGAAVLASNQFILQAAGASPSNNNFSSETQFLLYRDSGAAANAAYDVFAQASVAPNANGILAEVKMLVINGVPPNSSFQPSGGDIALTGSDTTFLTHDSALPAGDNVVIAAVALDNQDTVINKRTVSAGNLKLKRTGLGTLVSNQFTLTLDESDNVNRGTGFLLVALDSNAPANQEYTLTGIDTAGGATIHAEGKMIVLNGVPSAFIDGGSVNVGTSATPLIAGGGLATIFPAGENAVIAAEHYTNTAGAQRNITAGNEDIAFGGANVSSSQYDLNLCNSGSGTECQDFASGLLWTQSTANSNPTYDFQARANNTGIQGETKLLAIHLSSPAVDWQEIFP